MGQNVETKLDSTAFLVSETDERGIIRFANEDFCKIAEYSVDELIGKPHNVVRHPDMPRVAFKDLWDTVKAGKIWKGYVKNSTKTGGYYWVFATVYPIIACDGSRGFLSCRKQIGQDEINEYEKKYRQLKEHEG